MGQSLQIRRTPAGGAGRVESSVSDSQNLKIQMIDGQHAQKVEPLARPTFASFCSTFINFSATYKSYFSTIFNFPATFASWIGQLFNISQLFSNLQKLLLATYGWLESNLRPCGGVLRLTLMTCWQLAKVTFKWSQVTFQLNSTFRQLATVTFQICQTFGKFCKLKWPFFNLFNFSATYKSYFG